MYSFGYPLNPIPPLPRPKVEDMGSAYGYLFSTDATDSDKNADMQPPVPPPPVDFGGGKGSFRYHRQIDDNFLHPRAISNACNTCSVLQRENAYLRDQNKRFGRYILDRNKRLRWDDYTTLKQMIDDGDDIERSKQSEHSSKNQEEDDSILSKIVNKKMCEINLQ